MYYKEYCDSDTTLAGHEHRNAIQLIPLCPIFWIKWSHQLKALAKFWATTLLASEFRIPETQKAWQHNNDLEKYLDIKHWTE